MAIKLFRFSQATAEQISRVDSIAVDNKLGFIDVVANDSIWRSSVELGSILRANYDHIFILGTGGSSVGTQAIRNFFLPQCLDFELKKDLSICDTLDPIYINDFVDNIKKVGRPGFLLVSKSGSTLETLLVIEYLQLRLGSSFVNNCFVISDPIASPLREWATKFGRPIYDLPRNLGGRFSVLSQVGMAPAAFLGIDIEDIRKGAKELLTLGRKDVAAFVSESMLSFAREEWITQFWFYSHSLAQLGPWIQQLWAESLAKRETLGHSPAPRVSTPVFQIGPRDQHSVLQQASDGFHDKWTVFVRSKSLEGERLLLPNERFLNWPEMSGGKDFGAILGILAESTQIALESGKVHVNKMEFIDQSPRTLGYAFLFFELAVAAIADLLQIDAFDQPGVELGKRLAKDSLRAR